MNMKKRKPPTLDIEALRNIGRIVRGIKARSEAKRGNQHNSASCSPNTGSGAAIGAMGGEDPDRGKEEKR
jgi:hypothetical protein